MKYFLKEGYVYTHNIGIRYWALNKVYVKYGGLGKYYDKCYLTEEQDVNVEQALWRYVL